MSETEPPEILASGAETYREKNDDYGDSWRQVGEILHLLADGNTVELETRRDHISYGLYTRRLDKLARAYHGEFNADEMNFEPTVDAHEDEMTYASMHASLLHNPPDERRSQQAGFFDKISQAASTLSTLYDKHLQRGNRQTGEESGTGNRGDQ
jgi:hypothetical protein